MKTTVINLYGGPGTGKSTSAAFLFYLLKAQGDNAELVREYVKDWAWEDRKINAFDQLYFLGKQIRRESMLYGKVSHIVTDSPINLNVLYARRYAPPAIAKGVTRAVLGFYEVAAESEVNHVHVMLRRSKAYNPMGRFQNASEARALDGDALKLLAEMAPEHATCATGEASLRRLVEKIDQDQWKGWNG